MRRIEAFTGMEAYSFFRQRREMMETVAATLKVETSKLPERVERVVQRVKDLESELKKRDREEVASLVSSGVAWEESEMQGGTKVVTARVEDLDTQALRELAERTLAGKAAGVVGIVTTQGGKANLVVALSGEMVEAGLDAVELIRKAGRLLGGGGGGRADMAVGGGSETGRLAEALEVVVDEVRASLEKGHA